MQLLCVGDIAIEEGGLQPWPPPLETPADGVWRTLLNWELPAGGALNPIPRSSGPRLLAHPDAPAVLARWAPGFACLATNHILDAGAEGLARTQAALRQAGFETLGAGRTAEEAARPLRWETAEGALALLNWVFPETHPDSGATPGPNVWPGFEAAAEALAQARRGADWVFAVVHWSDECFGYPRPEDRAAARRLLALGADAVIGHHPHVVRGVETIAGRPVFYSLGNLYFTSMTEPRAREGLGVRFSLRRGERPAYDLLSFWQSPGRAERDARRRAERRLRRVSRVLAQTDGGAYAAWYAIRRRRYDRWGHRWHFGVRRLGWAGTLRVLWRKAWGAARGIR